MEKNNKPQTNPKEATAPADVELLEKKPIVRSKFLPIWIAIIILLGLLAGLFWFFQQQLHTEQLKTAALTENVLSTEQLNHTFRQFEQSVTVDNEATEQRFTELNAANNALLDKVDSLAKAQKLTNDGVLRFWTLAELKFLLQTANQSVLLAGDIDKAQKALELADKQVLSLTDPRLHELRTLIADEKLALASVAQVDVDGLAMQLQSALNKVDDLDVLMGQPFSDQTNNGSANDSSLASTWQMALTKTWQEIKSLVVIRHQQDAAVAVLVPEQRYFLYQNLRLKLESAKLGLLSGREVAFHDNLASTAKWLQQYFIGPERDAMLEMVTEMQSQTIAVDFPDISASLNWLQQYGDQQ